MVTENNLLAPNGKISNLSVEQYYIVRTPEFKEFFGDWEALAFAKIKDSGMDEITLSTLSKDVSKIVDENGEPKILFHGSKIQFTVFDKDSEKQNRTSNLDGFYFISRKENADYYAAENGYTYSCFLNIKKPLFIQKYKPSEKAVEYISDKYKDKFHEDYLRGKLYDLRERGTCSFVDGKDRAEIAVIDGYDGMIDGSINNGEVCCFESNQIKLADGTNVTFDKSNPDIRYAKGGKLEKYRKFGDWTVTNIIPISYGDLGEINGGEIKIVNQDNFETYFIFNDRALRGNKWAISYDGVFIEDKDPNIVIEKFVKKYNSESKFVSGGDIVSLSKEDEMPFYRNADTDTNEAASGEVVQLTEGEFEVINDNDNDGGGSSGGEKDKGKGKKKSNKKGKNKDGGDGDGEDEPESDGDDKEGEPEGEKDKGKSKGKGKGKDDDDIIDIPYPPPVEEPEPPQPCTEPPTPSTPNENAPNIDAVQMVLDDLSNLSDVMFYLLTYMNYLVYNKVAKDYDEIERRCKLLLWNRYANNILMTKKSMLLKDADSLAGFNLSFTNHCSYVREVTVFRNGYNYIDFDKELEVLQGLTLNMIKDVLQTYVDGSETDTDLFTVNTFLIYAKSIIVYFDKVKKYDDNYFRIISMTSFLNAGYVSDNYLQLHLEFMKSFLCVSTLSFKNESPNIINVRNVIILKDEIYVYYITKQRKGDYLVTINKSTLNSLDNNSKLEISDGIITFYINALLMLNNGDKKNFLEINKINFNLQYEICDTFLRNLRISLNKKKDL